MARARNIKPGFFTNDDLAQCEYGARLLFVGLWTVADREGRMEDRPARIKALLFPFDRCNIDNWLLQLEQHRFITRYEIAGSKYIQVSNFCKHQHPHVKEPESTIPAPDLSGAKTPDCGLPLIDSGLRIPGTAGPSRFAPPSLADVAAYCAERGNHVSPEAWLDHYTSNGWKVGKNPMKDWKAAVRTWEKNGVQPAVAGKSQTRPPVPMLPITDGSDR